MVLWKYYTTYILPFLCLYCKSPFLVSKISLLFMRCLSSLRCVTKPRLGKMSLNILCLCSYILLHPLSWKPFPQGRIPVSLPSKSLMQQTCAECNPVHAMYSARYQRGYMRNNSCKKMKVNHITSLLCLSIRRKLTNCIVLF